MSISRGQNASLQLSLILPCVGNSTTRFTVASLKRQVFPSRLWELIVVRERDTDTSALRHLAELSCKIQVVDYERPYGFSGHTAGIMRNIASRRATSRILVFLDSDAVISPTYLQEHYKLHRTLGAQELVVCGMWLELPATQNRILNSSWSYQDLARLSTPDFRSGPARVGTWEDFYSGNVSLRKTLFEAAGRFDERGYRCHDMDLAYRMSRLGAVFRLSPECPAIHIEHPRSIRSRLEQAQGWINLSKKCPEIRKRALNRAAELEHSFDTVKNACRRRFHTITRGLPGRAIGSVFHASGTEGLWNRIRTIPSIAVVMADGVRYYLRLHRNCWDYAIHITRPKQPFSPRISVVVATYNRADFLRRCLLSVLCQTVQDFELIVIDDESTDESCAILSEFTSDPRVRILLNFENMGLAHCLNKGLETAASPILIHLDSDDVLSPRALERFIAAFSDPRVGAAFGCLSEKRQRSRPWTPEILLSSLDIHAPRAYRTSTMRQIRGWSTDDAFQGRYFEDRLTLARVCEVSRVTCIAKRVCEIGLTQDSLTRSDPHKAAAAKFSIVTNYANSHGRAVSVSRQGSAIKPHFLPRTKSSRGNSWSVVIPHRDRWRLLEYTLKSWLQSDLFERDSEILLVDDGSRAQRAFEIPDRRVSLLRIPTSKGAAYARNLAARHASKQFLFFCDADHIVPPDVIAQHEAAHHSAPQPAIVVGNVLGRRAVSRFDPTELTTEALQRIYNLARFDRGLFERLIAAALERNSVELVPSNVTNLFARLFKYSFSDHALAHWSNIILAHGHNLSGFAHRWIRVCAGNCSLPRVAFESIHGFDCLMPSMEDWELGARLQKRGFEILCAPDAEPLHLVHRRDRDRDSNNRRAITRLVAKHPHLVDLLMRDHAVSTVPGAALIESLLYNRAKASWSTTNTHISDRGRRDPNDKRVFLTFDDGPDVPGTNRILEILEKHSCRATFFVQGHKAAANLDLCREIISRGNELGIHGWDHSPIEGLSVAQITQSFSATLQILRSIPNARISWARPPYGTFTRNYRAAIARLRLKHATWDLSTRDWSCPTMFELVARIASTNIAGKVVLLHDGSGDPFITAESLDYLIPKMRRAGLFFVALSDR